mmetsp:Transcript_58040/g.166466  ORF Transcript_58040/g.166466 Transcript_58040/m.166466 type:complete len:200 (-) Transcript_58040:854-1453(-)
MEPGADVGVHLDEGVLERCLREDLARDHLDDLRAGLAVLAAAHQLSVERVKLLTRQLVQDQLHLPLLALALGDLPGGGRPTARRGGAREEAGPRRVWPRHRRGRQRRRSHGRRGQLQWARLGRQRGRGRGRRRRGWRGPRGRRGACPHDYRRPGRSSGGNRPCSAAVLAASRRGDRCHKPSHRRGSGRGGRLRSPGRGL